MHLTAHDETSVTIQFEDHELVIFHQILGSLVALLETRLASTGTSSPGVDPLENIFDSGSRFAPKNPTLLKLLPNAYVDDSGAADFRELTEHTLITQKLADINILQESLRTNSNLGEVTVTAEKFNHWVRAITSLRIFLADRNDLADIFDWLGYMLETLMHFQQFFNDK